MTALSGWSLLVNTWPFHNQNGSQDNNQNSHQNNNQNSKRQTKDRYRKHM
jgi:hypothetical protein